MWDESLAKFTKFGFGPPTFSVRQQRNGADWLSLTSYSLTMQSIISIIYYPLYESLLLV